MIERELDRENNILAPLVTAAHELKAPLSLIRQLSLSLGSQELHSSERDRMIQQILLTSERALRLTTDLSRSSRLENSLFELEPLNPMQVCEEVAHELTPLYVARHREIRVKTYHRSLLAIANHDLLRRVILNFGDNALHYAEANAPVELGSRLFVSKGRIRIGVRDYGPSLPIDVWRRIRLNLGTEVQTLHMRPQSSGLGLYIAGQFANAMHGDVGMIRHHDGSTFYVDIDASRQLSLL